MKLDNMKLLTTENLEDNIFFTEELLKRLSFSNPKLGDNFIPYNPIVDSLKQDIKDYQIGLEADPFDYGLTEY